MHLWQLNKWRKFYSGVECRQGLRLRFDKGVDPELRLAILKFANWVRREFDFPIRVVAYIRSTEYIKAKDGDLVSGTFWGPYDRTEEPCIRVAAGDFYKLTKKMGQGQSHRRNAAHAGARAVALLPVAQRSKAHAHRRGAPSDLVCKRHSLRIRRRN